MMPPGNDLQGVCKSFFVSPASSQALSHLFHVFHDSIMIGFHGVRVMMKDFFVGWKLTPIGTHDADTFSMPLLDLSQNLTLTFMVRECQMVHLDPPFTHESRGNAVAVRLEQLGTIMTPEGSLRLTKVFQR